MKRGKTADSSARTKQTERVAEIMPRFVSSLSKGKAYRLQMLIYYWEDIVGTSIAAHVRPVRMDFHKLFLSVDAPVWANELRYMERELIDKINAFVCEELVKDIGFCSPAGENRSRRNNTREEDTPETITPKQDEYEKTSSFVSEIEDDSLRLAASRALAQNFALRRTLSEEGWHTCASCERLVPSGETYCLLCAQKKKNQEEEAVRRLLLREPWLHGYEVSNILGCSSEVVVRERMSLLKMLLSRVKQGDETSEDAKKIVMLFASVKPEDLTEQVIQKHMQRLRFDLLSETQVKQHQKGKQWKGRVWRES